MNTTPAPIPLPSQTPSGGGGRSLFARCPQCGDVLDVSSDRQAMGCDSCSWGSWFRAWLVDLGNYTVIDYRGTHVKPDLDDEKIDVAHEAWLDLLSPEEAGRELEREAALLAALEDE